MLWNVSVITFCLCPKKNYCQLCSFPAAIWLFYGVNFIFLLRWRHLYLDGRVNEGLVFRSLKMYNSLVERCFSHCIENFRRKTLDKQEETCVKRCAEKYLKHSMRVSMRFAELNQGSPTPDWQIFTVHHSFPACGIGFCPASGPSVAAGLKENSDPKWLIPTDLFALDICNFVVEGQLWLLIRKASGSWKEFDLVERSRVSVSKLIH